MDQSTTSKPGWKAVFALWAIVGIASCCPPAPSPKPGARATLSAYAESLKRGDHQAALELLTAAGAKGITPAQLARFVKEGGASLARLLEAASQPAAKPASFHLDLGDGKTVVLVEEQGRWRMADGPLLPSQRDSPQATMDLFLRAIDAGDCSALVNTAPPATCARHTRKKLEQACAQNLDYLRQLAADLRLAGGAPVAESDDRAVLTYGKDRRVILVRIDDRWFLEDL